MIQASEFIKRAGKYGYALYAGLPCPFLMPIINAAIDSKDVRYLSAANEGETVAIAAGQALAGQRAVALMQNAGLGSAMPLLTMLNWVYQLPLLLIVTWRGQPGIADEPDNALMGRITPDVLESMEIPWEEFPDSPEALGEALARADTHMRDASRPYALVLKKDAIAPVELGNTSSPSQSRGAITFRPAPPRKPTLSRYAALCYLLERIDPAKAAIIASTGYAGRELQAIGDHANQFYVTGAAGYASSIGLGLALARPDLQVIVVDGDGAALKHLGSMTTLAAYGPTNLFHLLLDNGRHESSGGQSTVSAGLSFAAIAAASGYRTAYEGHDRVIIDQMLAGSSKGPAFAHLHIAPNPERAPLPSASTPPVEVKRRFMAYIKSSG